MAIYFLGKTLGFQTTDFLQKNYEFSIQGTTFTVPFEDSKDCKVKKTPLSPSPSPSPSNISLLHWPSALAAGCVSFSDVIPSIDSLYSPLAIIFFLDFPYQVSLWSNYVGLPYGSSLEEKYDSFLVFADEKVFFMLNGTGIQVSLSEGIQHLL